MSSTTGFTSKFRVPGNKVTPVIESFNLTAANTEQIYTFPLGIVYFSVQNMGKTILRVSYLANQTANNGNYQSIYPNVNKIVEGIGAGNLSIYLRAPAVQRVEIEYWY